MAKNIGRRAFAKLAGGAALIAPLAPGLVWPQEAPKKIETPTPPAQPKETQGPQQGSKAEPKLKVTPAQEEAVKKATERRERQLATLRARVLPYDAEPAFVFQVRQRPRSARQKG